MFQTVPAMHDGALCDAQCIISTQIESPAALAVGQRLRRELGAKLKQLEMVQRKLARAQQHANNYQRMASRLDTDIQSIRSQLASLECHYHELARMVDVMNLDGLSPRTLAWLQRLRRSKSFGMNEMRNAAQAIEWDASDNHIRVTVSILKRKGYLESVARGVYQLSSKLRGSATQPANLTRLDAALQQ
jgi:chromosome segregation ATPase